MREKNSEILNGQVNFPLCLAPMVGLSHVALRMVIRQYLPRNAKTIWPTEMLNSRKLPHQVLGKTPETAIGDGEDFIVPQILGNSEKYIAPSVKKLVDWGAKAIDINMGCPVSKALKHNYGVSLMGDVEYAADVVRMTVENSTVPVSVKFRAGIKKDPEYLLNFVNKIVDAGASWVCLHPRLAKDKKRASADWKLIKILKENSSVPVIGNGDIQVLDDILRMLEETNCDSVMVGRALTARPWLLWQLGRKLGFENPEGLEGDPPTTPEEEAIEYGKMLKVLWFYHQKYFDDALAMRRFRFHLINSHYWLNYGHSLSSKMAKIKKSEDVFPMLENFFSSSSLRFTQKTLLI
jgi:tRNA-dihydrouridine synthase